MGRFNGFMSVSDPSRLDAVEIKLAHLERALTEISDVVVRQQKELEMALARHQRLSDQLAMIECDTAGTEADEKPPHY
jgi:SlyX protein